MNVTVPNTNQREFLLNCSTTYEFEVVARNEVGMSPPSTVRSATTGGDTTKKFDNAVAPEGMQIHWTMFLSSSRFKLASG